LNNKKQDNRMGTDRFKICPLRFDPVIKIY